MKTLCFTGHRPKDLGGYNENNPTAESVKLNLRDLILKSIERGFTTFISGMAIGVDQWAAEIVIDLKNEGHDIELWAFLPFEGQPCAWPTGRDRWTNILKEASLIKCINLDKNITFEEALELADNFDSNVQKWQVVKWLNLRNEALVNAADTVLGIWNGNPHGGTFNCLTYAQKQNKPIIVFDPVKDAVYRMEKND